MTTHAGDLHLITAPTFHEHAIAHHLSANLYAEDGLLEVCTVDLVLFEVRVSGDSSLIQEINARQVLNYAFGETGKHIPLEVHR